MILDLEWLAKVRKGRIHLQCPCCGYKMTNMHRNDETDPPRAVLAVVPCDKYRCSGGCKIEGCDYYDKDGFPISFDEVMDAIDSREEETI